MKTMIVKNPNVLTNLDIWSPRYKDKYGELAEPVVLMAKYKVDAASPVIIVTFSKAKHLMGQRYCIPRHEAQAHKLGSNTKIPCYEIPLSHLYTFNTVDEIKKTVNMLFPGQDTQITHA